MEVVNSKLYFCHIFQLLCTDINKPNFFKNISHQSIVYAFFSTKIFNRNFGGGINSNDNYLLSKKTVAALSQISRLIVGICPKNGTSRILVFLVLLPFLQGLFVEQSSTRRTFMDDHTAIMDTNKTVLVCTFLTQQ